MDDRLRGANKVAATEDGKSCLKGKLDFETAARSAQRKATAPAAMMLTPSPAVTADLATKQSAAPLVESEDDFASEELAEDVVLELELALGLAEEEEVVMPEADEGGEVDGVPSLP